MLCTKSRKRTITKPRCLPRFLLESRPDFHKKRAWMKNQQHCNGILSKTFMEQRAYTGWNGSFPYFDQYTCIQQSIQCHPRKVGRFGTLQRHQPKRFERDFKQNMMLAMLWGNALCTKSSWIVNSFCCHVVQK